MTPTVEERAILRELDTTPTMHVTDLAERADSDPATIDRECFRLHRAGYVRARAGGVYSITAKGEERLRRLLQRA